ncbi:MAG: type II toxin-antitoxin system HigB family toxin [Thermosynechococcaceae cyanobacterium]
MHIITRSHLIRFWEKHPNAKPSLQLWYRLTSKATWQDLVEVRQTFSSADRVGQFTVFNIGGNNYRLIILIDYAYQKVFVRHILTHAEYNKEHWKRDSWFNHS